MSTSPVHAHPSAVYQLMFGEPSDSPVVPRLDGRSDDVMAANDAAANTGGEPIWHSAAVVRRANGKDVQCCVT